MLCKVLMVLGAAVVNAAPAPAPIPQPTAYAAAAAPVSQPTAAPEIVERDLLDDVGSFVESLAGGVASEVSSFVNSGILDFPSGFPAGTAVQSSLGISDGDLDAQPTQVLNLPAYGNWTDAGWNVRIHGNVYKIPEIDQDKIDDLANVFLIDTDVEDLDESQKAQARNVTRSIFVVQQDDRNVTINFVRDVDVDPNESGGAIDARAQPVLAQRADHELQEGGAQNITMPYQTTREGDFDAFVTLRNTTGPDGGHLRPGNQTSQIQTLNMYAQGTNTGNATAYLVPTEGITILSDIDDILRVTKIYDPKEGLLNTFARPFTPWMNMPEIYANWSSSIQDLHFHYLTTTPEQITRNYMDFIYNTYPLGSFDTRPLNFSDTSATLSIRRSLLDKIFQTFPQRRFILVGDTTNSDVMKAYPELYHAHAEQVACILLRNTTSTDSSDRFPYDTSGFEGIPQQHYMFFNVPDDLRNLDIANGQCLNATVPQNVTFDYQGLPFGLGGDDEGAAGNISPPKFLAALVGFATVILGVAW
ncbi:actin patch protein 1 [Paramyrothecium foliicola]|nr:actin patch protein 1 [Paramyrothecium foliicola]